MSDKTPVAVGQLYADRDPRAAGRTLQVTQVVPASPLVEAYAVLVIRSVARNVGKQTIGRERRIKLRRLQANSGYGYELLDPTSERAQLLAQLSKDINDHVAEGHTLSEHGGSRTRWA